MTPYRDDPPRPRGRTDDERRFWEKFTNASRYFPPEERRSIRSIYPGWSPGCNLGGIIFDKHLRESQQAHPRFAKLCTTIVSKGLELGLTWADKAEIIKPHLGDPEIGASCRTLYADMLRNHAIDPAPLPKASDLKRGTIGSTLPEATQLLVAAGGS